MRAPATLLVGLAAPGLLLTACLPGQPSSHPGRKAAASPAGSASPRTPNTVPAPGPPSPQPGAEAVPQLPPQAPYSVDLTFSGTVAGRVQGTQPLGTCGRLGSAYSAQLQFDVSGEPLVLGIQVFDYHGPGRYSIPPERVSVHSPGVGAGSRFMPAKAGDVTVDAGESSGGIQATLDDGRGSATVQGTWTCSRPPAA